MRNIVKVAITILFFGLPSVQSFGQEDTLKQSAGREDYRINSRYRDRTMALSVKAIGGIMIPYPDFFMYGIGTTFEFKIKDYHSVSGGINLLNSESWFPIMGYHSTKTCLQVEMGYRYYHNLKNRMSKGRTGNNFSANYFLLSPGFWLQYKQYILEDYYWDFTKGLWVLEYSKPLVLRPDVRLGYGLQRTFWRNLNFDINGGIQFTRWEGPVTAVDLLFELSYIQFSLGYIIK